jgi:hypothetical protein
MAELKTQRHDGDVTAFLDSIPDPTRRKDAKTIFELLSRITGDSAAMWGASMVGFGERTYHYASGRAGTWFNVGFSPRKQNTTVYTYGGFDDPGAKALLDRLGPHSTGKGCLYVKRLDAVDLDVLDAFLRRDQEQRVREQA